MKVVQINTYYQYGSTGRILSELETEMRRNGIEPYAIYGRDMTGEKFGPQVFSMYNEWSWYTHKYTNHILGYQGYSSVEQTKRAVDFLDTINPDIIHLHNLHGYYLNLEILFNYIHKTSKPVVWTFHDCWPFTGHCAYFHTVGCNRWINGCGRCPLKTNYPRSLFFDRSIQQWSDKKRWFSTLSNLHIVTVSNWLKSLVEQSFFKDCDIRTIYNGIDTSIFAPYPNVINFKKQLGLEEKKIILGVASGWTERKGFKDFLYMAENVPSNTVIILVGEVSSKIKVPKNLILYGRTNNTLELAKLYSIADVFVNPSRQETFGLTTAEAMACGTPSIVYNTTACPEVVGDNKCCGDVVYKINEKSLFEKVMLRLSQKKDKTSTRDWVVNKFNKEEQLKQYIMLYESI